MNSGCPCCRCWRKRARRPRNGRKRVRFVRRAAFRFYRRIVENLGEDAAAKLFECVSKGVKGRPSGSADPVRDGELWTAYQASLKLTREEDQAALARLLAESLYEERGRYFGNSAAAIEKRLRRLIKQQQDRRGRIKAAKKSLEAARRRPLTKPWPGTKSVAMKADSTEPDTKSRE